MGRITKQPPVKLICGFIFQDHLPFERAKRLLEKRFGQIDFESSSLPFNHTAYYEREFGTDLVRRFVSFRKLIPPERIARIKILTNKYEQKFCSGAKRTINIDPGYLDRGKLILATTKDHKHRICLGSGIYAEVTLFFEDKTYKPWEWTYPDYKSQDYIQIFNQMREFYLRQVKK